MNAKELRLAQMDAVLQDAASHPLPPRPPLPQPSRVPRPPQPQRPLLRPPDPLLLPPKQTTVGTGSPTNRHGSIPVAHTVSAKTDTTVNARVTPPLNGVACGPH